MKRYFLGLGANTRHPFRHAFKHGNPTDTQKLTTYLEERYSGTTLLVKNGRTALAISLMAYLPEGSRVFINGFTCFAVVEAVKAAKMEPVFVDVSPDNLNFNSEELEKKIKANLKTPNPLPTVNEQKTSDQNSYKTSDKNPHKTPCATGAIVVQNTLGHPVDITKIEQLARKYHLVLIEDLAHSAGIFYPDGREAGTVGDASVFSFGKDKAIDTILGGAVVLRRGAASATSQNNSKILRRSAASATSQNNSQKNAPFSQDNRNLPLPNLPPRKVDNLRARIYSVIGLFCRKLTGVKLAGPCMWLALKLRLVEKSADNAVDFEHQIADFESALALEQFQKLQNRPLRKFFLVEDRDQILRKLRESGYFFDAFWYETPVSPKRYYKKSGFNPKECPVAVEISKHIINFPNYYSDEELAPAYQIVKQAKEWRTNE